MTPDTTQRLRALADRLLDARNDEGNNLLAILDSAPEATPLREALQELVDAEWMVTHDWGGNREAILEKARRALLAPSQGEPLCDCHLHEHQVCDICQGVRASQVGSGEGLGIKCTCHGGITEDAFVDPQCPWHGAPAERKQT
jgi:hypothetical protein